MTDDKAMQEAWKLLHVDTTEEPPLAWYFHAGFAAGLAHARKEADATLKNYSDRVAAAEQLRDEAQQRIAALQRAVEATRRLLAINPFLTRADLAKIARAAMQTQRAPGQGALSALADAAEEDDVK